MPWLGRDVERLGTTPKEPPPDTLAGVHGRVLSHAGGAAWADREKLLRASEALYRASFEQAAVGILHTSLEGRILECNECFARMVGYARRELVGSSFQAITPPEDWGRSDQAAEHLLSGEKQTVRFEKRYLRKDGSLTWGMLTISIQYDENGEPLCFLALAQEINDRKQAEERLAAAKEALRLSEERYRTAFQGAGVRLKLLRPFRGWRV